MTLVSGDGGRKLVLSGSQKPWKPVALANRGSPARPPPLQSAGKPWPGQQPLTFMCSLRRSPIILELLTML